MKLKPYLKFKLERNVLIECPKCGKKKVYFILVYSPKIKLGNFDINTNFCKNCLIFIDKMSSINYDGEYYMENVYEEITWFKPQQEMKFRQIILHELKKITKL